MHVLLWLTKNEKDVRQAELDFNAVQRGDAEMQQKASGRVLV